MYSSYKTNTKHSITYIVLTQLFPVLLTRRFQILKNKVKEVGGSMAYTDNFPYGQNIGEYETGESGERVYF